MCDPPPPRCCHHILHSTSTCAPACMCILICTPSFCTKPAARAQNKNMTRCHISFLLQSACYKFHKLLYHTTSISTFRSPSLFQAIPKQFSVTHQCTHAGAHMHSQGRLKNHNSYMIDRAQIHRPAASCRSKPMPHVSPHIHSTPAGCCLLVFNGATSAANLADPPPSPRLHCGHHRRSPATCHLSSGCSHRGPMAVNRRTTVTNIHKQMHTSMHQC